MVTNHRAHMHTHTVKLINAYRELCRPFYQQASSSRPCLSGSEVDARDIILVLGPFREDWVLAHRKQQGVLQNSSPFSTQTQRMTRDVCQGLPKYSLPELASHWAGLTHTSPRNITDKCTNQLLQNWGCHQLFPGGDRVSLQPYNITTCL